MSKIVSELGSGLQVLAGNVDVESPVVWIYVLDGREVCRVSDPDGDPQIEILSGECRNVYGLLRVIRTLVMAGARMDQMAFARQSRLRAPVLLDPALLSDLEAICV